MNQSIGISEFRKGPNKSVSRADDGLLVVLTHDEPSFYVMSPAVFEKFAEIISDLDLAPKLKKRVPEIGKAVPMKIEDL
jgi:antitoxin StbD